jgi:leucyl aminopeptidase
MANYVKDLFKDKKNVKVTIFDNKMLTKKKFGLIKAIGDSGLYKANFVIVERKAKPKSKKVCIVGKGVTFDSGGLTVKDAPGMVDMKYDKIGAVYAAYSLLHLIEDSNMESIHFLGLFPFAENAISEYSCRPGDVFTSYGGTKVEIIIPDAEGRLLLADSFDYAMKHFKPDMLIDIATLTGHSDSLNCWHSATYYCENEKLKDYIEKYSYKIGERMIAMPTWDDKDDVFKSVVADITNDPFKCSDSFIAARFLRQFVDDNLIWIHFDLAHELKNHLPSGNAIRTLIEVARKIDLKY